jgi:hypothetical protein
MTALWYVASGSGGTTTIFVGNAGDVILEDVTLVVSVENALEVELLEQPLEATTNNTEYTSEIMPEGLEVTHGNG